MPAPLPPLPLPTPTRVTAAGFSFLLPDGWIDLSPGAPAENFARVPASLAEQARVLGAVVYAVAPERAGVHWPRLRVELLDDRGPVTPERVETIAEGIVTLLERVPSTKPRRISAESIKIAGVPAGRILVGLSTPGGEELRLLSFLLPGTERDALLSFDVAADRFDELRPTLESAAAGSQGLASPRS